MFDLNELKKEILAELKGLDDSKPRQTAREPQENAVFERLAKALTGVGTPEIEFVLGSENIISIENEMKRKFDEFMFANYRAEFAKAYPEICEEYVNTAIKNKEDYARLNAQKIQEQAAELEKAQKANAELLKQIEELKKANKPNGGGGDILQ